MAMRKKVLIFAPEAKGNQYYVPGKPGKPMKAEPRVAGVPFPQTRSPSDPACWIDGKERHRKNRIRSSVLLSLSSRHGIFCIHRKKDTSLSASLFSQHTHIEGKSGSILKLCPYWASSYKRSSFDLVTNPSAFSRRSATSK